MLLDFLGDLAFNGLAHAEGRGALTGRLGTRVAAPVDQPVRLAALCPARCRRGFDAEGVPKAPLPLIQDGVAQARRARHAARRHAPAAAPARPVTRWPPAARPSGPSPTNLVMVGGGCADEAELAAPIERGLYVTRLWYVNTVQERQTLLTGMTRDGTFLIEDGRVTRARARCALHRLGPAHPRGHRGADGRRAADAARPTCTAGASPTACVCPALRAQGFRVTGTTTG